MLAECVNCGENVLTCLYPLLDMILYGGYSFLPIKPENWHDPDTPHLPPEKSVFKTTFLPPQKTETNATRLLQYHTSHTSTTPPPLHTIPLPALARTRLPHARLKPLTSPIRLLPRICIHHFTHIRPTNKSSTPRRPPRIRDRCIPLQHRQTRHVLVQLRYTRRLQTCIP